MEKKFKAEFVKDLQNKKITVRREFDASPELVWKAWTESKLLDQWWAPKPWQAKTKSLTFKEGGSWLYAMCGPDGTMIWSLVEFSSITKNSSFKAVSCFSDENGNKNAAFPTMYWKNDFVSTGSGTRVEVEIHFTSDADIQQIIAMGFEGGFNMGLENLDELLAKYELQNS
jgi:uncharacterized protein YndB with AHSA1/START domain